MAAAATCIEKTRHMMQRAADGAAKVRDRDIIELYIYSMDIYAIAKTKQKIDRA